MASKTKRMMKQIADLANDMAPGRFVDAVDTDLLTDSERAFVQVAHMRDKQVARYGWPDFLVVDGDGAALGVEVKQGHDFVRPSQAAMFTMLEQYVNLRVFVWNPARPTRLTPWRAYRPTGVRQNKHQTRGERK